MGWLFSYNKFGTAFPGLPVAALSTACFTSQSCRCPGAGEQGARSGAQLVAEAPALALRPWNNPQSHCLQTQIILTLGSPQVAAPVSWLQAAFSKG